MHLSSAVRATTCLPLEEATSRGIFDHAIETGDFPESSPAGFDSSSEGASEFESFRFFSGGSSALSLLLGFGQAASRWPLSTA